MKKLAFVGTIAFFLSPYVVLAAVGATCIVSGDSACDASKGEYCNTTNQECELTAAAASAAVKQTGGGQQTSGGGGGGYVPLAPIPGLTDAATANTENLAVFFNALYKFCIGAAVVLAVVQITRGGLMYMTSDVIPNKEHATSIIRNSIIGLILVLSPVLVFSIINPDILNLRIGLQGLQVQDKSGGNPDFSGGPGGSGGIVSPATETTTSGVTKKAGGTYLKMATFSSNNLTNNNNEAAAWATSECGGAVWKRVNSSTQCPGGYSSTGECMGGSTATVRCAFASPATYSFVNEETGVFGSGVQVTSQYKLHMTNSEGDAFFASCRSDNGSACVANQTSLTALPKCPPFSFTIPQNAPNAKNGGNCYVVPLVCAPANNIDKATICRPNITILQ